jgi:hypothetical protein
MFVFLVASIVQAATVDLPRGGILVVPNGTRYQVPPGSYLVIADDPMPQPPTPTVAAPKSWIFADAPYRNYRIDDEPYVTVTRDADYGDYPRYGYPYQGYYYGQWYNPGYYGPWYGPVYRPWYDDNHTHVQYHDGHRPTPGGPHR